MANWWKDVIDNATQMFDSSMAVLHRETKEADEALGRQKGIVPAVARAFVKVFRLFMKLIVWDISLFFPGFKTNADAIISGRVMEIPRSQWEETIAGLGKSLGLEAESIALLKSYFQPLVGVSPVVQGIALVQIYISLFNFLTGPGTGKVMRSMMRKIRPLSPGAGEVMGASALDPELDKRIWETLRNTGFEDKDIELMFASTYARHSPQEIQGMYYRGVLDEAGAVNRLQELRFTPERVKEILASWKLVPSIQDIIMMMAREAFEPGMIKLYGLDELYPEELTKWAAANGYDEKWARAWWSSHWQHPGLQTVLEMYHRGQVTEEQMWSYFGLVEIPPFWRERIMAISYNVLTRVDVRRMWQLGVIKSEEELGRRYRDMGYSPEDALLMVEWTKTYALDALKDLTRADILSGYSERDLTASEATGLLMRIGYPEDSAGYLVAAEDLAGERKRREALTKVVHDKYTGALITDGEARSALIQLQYAAPRIAELMEVWIAERAKGAKLPSKTDLDKFFKAGLIPEEAYKQELATLGYSSKYIGWYVGLAKKGVESSAE